MPLLFFPLATPFLAAFLRTSRPYFREYNKESRRGLRRSRNREETWQMPVGQAKILIKKVGQGVRGWKRDLLNRTSTG